MGTKTRTILVALVLCLSLGVIPKIAAVGLSIQEHRSIAPRSIPVPETGDPNLLVAVTRLKFRIGSSGDSNTSISRIDYQVTRTGAVAYSDIATVRVIFEPQGGAGTYDNGRPGGDDLNIQTGSSYNTTTGAGYVTIDAAAPANNFGWGASTHIFIVLEINSTADYASKVGCEITSVTYGAVGSGTGGPASPASPGAHNTQKDLDKYRNTLTATGIAPTTKDQGSTGVPVLRIQLAPVDGSVTVNPDMNLDKIKIRSLGTRDADIAAAGVLLYEDADADGVFEPGADDGEPIASGSLSGGYVTLNPPVDQLIGSSGKTFFVAVNVSLTAVVGDTIKLEVANPKTDFTFSDIIFDDNSGIIADYAYVYLGYPYIQKGYLTGTSATPTGGNSFTVTELYIPTAPTVTSIVPGNGATGILRSTTVTATFSEDMDSTTIVDMNTTDVGSNFIVFVDANSNSTYDTGETIVAGSVGYSNKVATFTPSAALDWTTTYTALVSTSVKDSNDGLNMTVAKIWAFATQAAIHPAVLSRSPVNGATEVNRSTTITATFSKDLNTATIIDADTTDAGSNFIIFVDANTNSVYDAGDTIVPGSVGYLNKVATFTLTAPPLAWGTTYTARIQTGVVDTEGLALQAAAVWTFTTTAPVYPLVSVTSPANGQSEVPRTDNVQATFSKDMNSASVVANFKLYDSGSNLVAGTVSWDGPSWTATLDPTPTLNWGETYTAKVLLSATSADGLPMLADKVWTFTTTMPIYPTVTLTSPANGDNEVSRTTAVSATFSKDMTGATVTSAFTLKDHLDNTVAGSGVYDGPSKTLTFTPGAELLWGKTYTARITTAATAIDGLAMQSAKVWTFTTTMPIYPIVITRSPVHGAIEVDPGANVTATFSKDIDASSISSSTFILFKDSNNNNLYEPGVDPAPVGASVSLTAPRIATLDPSGNLEWGTVYTMNVTTGVKDTVGLYMQAVSFWYFTTKIAVNPFVTSTVPAPDATGVLPGAVVTATFSKNMTAGTINAATFTLKDDGSAPVAGSVTFDGTTTATFTPSVPLIPGKKYLATVHGDGSSGAQATDGLYLLSDKTWSFWTSTRPAVLSVNPADNGVGVSRGASIKIVFSKDVDPATLTSTSVVLKHSSGAQVAGSISYDSTTYTATFTPSAELAFATYTVTVAAGASGVKDGYGIEMAAGVTWSFSTVPSLSEPIAANNRIMPGSSAPVTVFVPQPPAGASDKVTVQVFTPAGKRVATLVNAKPYSELLADLPLLWDGTNGRAQKLGPGLYFIRISATGWVRTLKVMIVR